MRYRFEKVFRYFVIGIMLLAVTAVLAPASEMQAGSPPTWFKSPTTPVLSVGTTWDNGGVGTASVILDGSTYKMWYTGYDDTNGLLQIGYATSSDGRSWQRGNAGNPVLTPSGAEEAEGIGAPRVIKDGVTYKMWYTGYKNVSGVSIPQIFYATSSNGTSWDRQNGGNPVLIPGAAGKFDDKGVHSPAVINDGGTYKMWYTGRSGDTLLGVSKIGYAISPDGGLTWNRQNNGDAVMTGTTGTWNADGVATPCVIKTDKYYMWFSGYSNFHANDVQVKIGYAESDDGIVWTPSSAVSIDKTASGWSVGGVGAPWVIQHGSGAPLEMWYSGVDTNLDSKVGYAATPNATITVTATLQGDNRPLAGYQVPLTMKLYEQAVTSTNIWNANPALMVNPVLTLTSGGQIVITGTPTEEEITAKTNKTITFTVSSLPPGSFYITLYSPQCLVNYETTIVNIPVSAGTLTMGELKAGDAVDIVEFSKAIDVTDFTSFASAYEAIPTSGNWNAKADFDKNNLVAIIDFSLLYTNYGKVSPQNI